MGHQIGRVLYNPSTTKHGESSSSPLVMTTPLKNAYLHCTRLVSSSAFPSAFSYNNTWLPSSELSLKYSNTATKQYIKCRTLALFVVYSNWSCWRENWRRLRGLQSIFEFSKSSPIECLHIKHKATISYLFIYLFISFIYLSLFCHTQTTLQSIK